MEGSFTQGFWFGVVVATVVGLLASRLRLAWKAMTLPGSPQKVSHDTRLTPLQVLWAGCLGLITVMIFAVLLVAVLYVVYQFLAGNLQF